MITNYGLSGQVLGGEIGQAMLDSPAGPPKLGLVGLGILEGGLRKPVGREVALPLVGHATWHAYRATIDAGAWPRNEHLEASGR